MLCWTCRIHRRENSLHSQGKTSHSHKETTCEKELNVLSAKWMVWHGTSEDLCTECLAKLGEESRHARMRAISSGSGGNMKEGRGGCGRTDPTVRKCVDQKSGGPQDTSPDHQSSCGFFHHHCQGHSEGGTEGITYSQTKESPVKTLVFANARCAESGERGWKCIICSLGNCTLSPSSSTVGSESPKFPSPLNISRKPNGKIPSAYTLGFLCMIRTRLAKTEKWPLACPSSWLGEATPGWSPVPFCSIFRSFKGAAFPKLSSLMLWYNLEMSRETSGITHQPSRM